jgi:predicted O-methyltransferase YrrM
MHAGFRVKLLSLFTAGLRQLDSTGWIALALSGCVGGLWQSLRVKKRGKPGPLENGAPLPRPGELPGKIISAETASKLDRDAIVTAALMYTPAIFNTMRILKRLNPADTFLEAYFTHFRRHGAQFFDHYHLAWLWAHYFAPRRILEIGTRTGISLCQLLSAYVDQSVIETAITCDPFLNESSPETVRANLEALNLPVARVEICKAKSCDLMAKLIEEKRKFDWILIDGDHSHKPALQDLDDAVLLIDVGGVIIFDDISETGLDLLGVWKNWKKKPKPGTELRYFEDLHGKGTGWAVRVG